MTIELKPFSEKQLDIIGHSANNDYSCLSYGAFRSGKTFAAVFGMYLYTQALQQSYNHIISGRNLRILNSEVVEDFRKIADAFDVPSKFNRVDQLLVIGDQRYYVAAGHDEDSRKRVQGLTAHSALIDEAVEVPESFHDAVLGRLSFDESKVWLTCNPGGKSHWLNKKWVEDGKIDRVVFCLMQDNPTMGKPQSSVTNQCLQVYSTSDLC